MIALVRALRPKQWVKNTFCLAPLVFARQAGSIDSIIQAAMIFGAFSLIASAVYLANDVVDRKLDRLHPVKCKRPIASGALSVPVALGAAFVLALASLAIAMSSDSNVVLVLGAYLALNVAYTLWLKHVVLLDIFTIAIGFVLRVVAGAEAISVSASQWILTCTLFIALLMAASKRRSEVQLQGQEKGTRKVLSRYSLRYLDIVITVVASGAILSNALYAMAGSTIEHLETAYLIYTLPFVIFAVFRYIYLVMEEAQGESPFELLVGDGAMIVNVAAYGVVTLLLVYMW